MDSGTVWVVIVLALLGGGAFWYFKRGGAAKVAAEEATLKGDVQTDLTKVENKINPPSATGASK
jgi:hypothetical protein